MISWFEEKLQIMTDKGFFKQLMSQKIVQFPETEEAANTDWCNEHSYLKIPWVSW